MTEKNIGGYAFRDDRYYDEDNNFWIRIESESTVSVGIDTLGLDISGTLSQLSLSTPPLETERGTQIGSIEAEKFVGPLVSPLAGKVVNVNQEALQDLSMVYQAPYDTWLFQIEPANMASLASLVQPENSEENFKSRIENYKKAGVLAW